MGNRNQCDLLYKILHFPARLALRFYCRRLVINRPEYLRIKGPVLIAANHPNSFLDAIILASIFRQPIYSLARGDAFISPFYNKLLVSLNMLPVYRISEGSKNLHHNYDTFGKVNDLLANGKIVLIFSEGLCKNEWHLRPLKKGTARIAFTAWQNNLNVGVLPAGINYSSFYRFGKDVILNFGNSIKAEIFCENSPGTEIKKFNAILKDELSQLVFEIGKENLIKRKKIFGTPSSAFKKALLLLPAVVGYILHAPLYFIASSLIKNKADVHYDSIMVGIFFLTYPIYILLITFLAYFISRDPFTFTLLVIMPLTALSLLHYRNVLR